MPRDGGESFPQALLAPEVRLMGEIDEGMARMLADGLAGADDGEDAPPLVVELSTPGGDPDVARRMVSDVRLFRGHKRRRLMFLGKGPVYSAGVTFMSGFARGDRWLSREAVLLIHHRSITKSIELSGPLVSERPKLAAALSELDASIRLEREDFVRLLEGGELRLDELLRRAGENWYVSAEEAVELGLAAGTI